MKDIMNMMKQAQSMQAQLQENMAKLQNDLLSITIEGQSGGGMVRVSMDGKHNLKAVNIDPSLLAPSEKEILEDLLIAAHNDAKAKVETTSAEKMKELTGGMALPPGLGNLFG